jgi:hypothetical protein
MGCVIDRQRRDFQRRDIAAYHYILKKPTSAQPCPISC